MSYSEYMYNSKHDFNILILFVVVFLGEDFYEPSPYEPMTPHRHSDAFRLASIISGKHKHFHYDLFLYCVYIFCNAVHCLLLILASFSLPSLIWNSVNPALNKLLLCSKTSKISFFSLILLLAHFKLCTMWNEDKLVFFLSRKKKQEQVIFPVK